jgi:probable rRNA maturation factor
MILNRQRSVRVSVGELDKFLERALRRLRLPGGALTICLVDNAEMARWNRSYRGKKGPTDVLSFPTNGPQRNGTSLAAARQPKRGRVARSNSYLGDIAIAPAVARRNARRFGRTFSEEMRILMLHGILHLMGYDHESDDGQMDRREQRLRRECGLD